MAALSFVNIPLIVSLIGLEDYEVYVLAASLAGWYYLIDLGLGSALQNLISTCRVQKKDYFAYIVNAIFLILSAFLLVTFILWLLADVMGQMLLQKYASITQLEKGSLFLEISILLMLLGSSNIINRIWYGEQRGYLSNLVPALGYVISFLLLEIIAQRKVDTSVAQVILIWYLPVCTIQMVLLFHRLKTIGSSACLQCIKKDILMKLWMNCKGFWLFAFLSVVTLQINYIIMSQFVYDNGMVVYNLVDKLMNLSFFVYTAILSALWPVFTECFSQNNWSKVLGYCRRYIMLGVLVVVVCVLFSVQFMPYIANLLLHGNYVEINSWFIVMFGIYYIMRVWTDTFAIILQSRNNMRPFILMVPLQAFFSVVFQYYLVTDYGIYGILGGLMISYILTVVWYLPYKVYCYYKKEMKMVVD